MTSSGMGVKWIFFAVLQLYLGNCQLIERDNPELKKWI
jgi:hypothetical protein